MWNAPRNLSINQMSNPGRHGRNTMRKKQGTSVCRSFFSLLNMQSNNNEAAILPIDSFLEKSFPLLTSRFIFQRMRLHSLWGQQKDGLTSCTICTSSTMTIGDKSQMVRHPCRYGHLPMFARSLPLKKCGVSSIARQPARQDGTAGTYQPLV